MANSLMIGCAKVGLDFYVVAPKSLWPSVDLIQTCKGYQEVSGGKLVVTENIQDAKDMDVVYTDVWCSMGEEEKAAERVAVLKPYQINSNFMKNHEKGIVMHCLPAVKGNEVTEEVFEDHADTIFAQAENRMHTIKAVMVASLSDKE